MIKFIVPAILIFFIVLFWEKINEMFYKKFKIKINLIGITLVILVLGIILILLYF
jgi:hypothetical protein